MYMPFQRLLEIGLSEEEASMFSRVHININKEELSDDEMLNIIAIVKKLQVKD